ncbi:MAG: Lacal_2735 family protein [Algoriphagus sp.]|jgi:predicted ATP-dependent protease|nr:Lacal_2735 family protein [Bacteroidota bacterium]MCE2707593.1 Lacal_2735 family protein [Algoriphagus sp.]NDE61281.1 Lacal_2735 family protein [Cyclobacteriaceae bacterium]
MFGLFKKKTEKEKLQESYAKMMAEAYKLSHSNRTAADKLMAEAEELAKKIDALKE